MIVMNKKWLNYIIFIFSIILIFSSITFAEKLTLKEAINIGLRENSDIIDIKEQIEDLETSLEIINAQKDWQINISANYNQMPVENSVELNINKNFSSGLNLNPAVKIIEEDDDAEFTFNASQKIYPLVPIELDKNSIKTQAEIKKREFFLSAQKVNKIVSWIESYFNLIRMIEKREIYQEALKQAEEHMKEVKKKEAISEAGEESILNAKIAVKEAEYRLVDINYQIKESKDIFYQVLKLKDEQKLMINENSELWDAFIEMIKKTGEEYLSNDNLAILLEDNNYDLLSNKIDESILFKELNWLNKEDNPDINLTAKYNNVEDELEFGLNMSYNLYDGGKDELNYQNKEKEISSIKEDYQNKYNELKIELEKFKNDIVLNEMILNKDTLNLKKSRNQAIIGKKQFEMGLIDYLEYQELFLDSKESEINLKSSEDRLILSKLKLIKFINPELISGGLNK